MEIAFSRVTFGYTEIVQSDGPTSPSYNIHRIRENRDFVAEFRTQPTF